MALYVQPYNPWREQLLASFLGPFISDMLGRSRAADMNRKKSAFLGELANQSQPLVDTSMPQGPQSMGGPSLYDSESAPWARSWGAGAGGGLGGGLMDGALSNGSNTSPFLQQFDVAVRGTAQPQSRNLGIGDVMLDPAEMMGLAQPYLNEQAATARARGLSDFKSAVMGQRDPEGFIRQLLMGTVDGYLDKGVFGDMVDWNKHRNPHLEYKDVNLGDRVLGGAFNPGTGEMMKLFEKTVQMNPYQREQTDIGWGKLGLDQQKFGEDIRQFDTAHDLNERKFGEQKTQNAFNRELRTKESQRPRPGARRLVQDAAGNFISVDLDTNTSTDIGVKGAKKPEAMPRISEVDKQDLKSINKQVQDVWARRKDPKYHWGNPDKIAALDAEEKDLLRQQQAILAKYREQGDPNLDALVRDVVAEDPDDGLDAVNGGEPDMPLPPDIPSQTGAPSPSLPNQPMSFITKQQYLRLIERFGKPETDKMIREAGAKVR